ncbi:alpha/beta fold hydrolase [Pseudoduganella buxea]|uniref:Alpha/beta fold hydrolase n=1 Tax=Pseudoduganella buxea TaxID=1949069 RepID=A0A6I3T9H1_9BURK|nr:alpha/beta fold hydrolase [Pseudoduganella buxea]MTV56317.1 alpha/beta fold hydrolase [Pseudoduganella buxea]GGB95720.1 hypothetical protein GCM10011572_17120 [Pseudoduganella buxea]
MTVAGAVLSIAPLARQLEHAIGLPARLDPADADAIARLFAAAGLPRPRTVEDNATLSGFDKAALAALQAAPLTAAERADARAAIGAARASGLDGIATRRLVTSADGTVLPAVRAGTAGGADTLLIGAPGMPIGLMAGWLRHLGRHGRVASWETRGLFGSGAAQVTQLGIDAQVADALAVMDDLGCAQGHVVGVCGGAVLALAFAARYPHRVRSLVLWLGDFELGDLAPKTSHQRDLQALMGMVVDGKVAAAGLRDVLVASMAHLSEPDLAPFALYPFANPALLARYCHMNHPIMATDCRQYAVALDLPCLVGYSPADRTTHPQGSRALAGLLDATLVEIEPCGHLAGLRGSAADMDRILAFQHAQAPR